MKRHKNLLLWLSLFTVFTVYGLSLAGLPLAAEPLKNIVIAQKGDVVSLNPLLTSDYASSTVYHRIFSGLLKYDENMKIICSLADSYQIKLNQYLTIDTNEISDADFIRIEKDCRSLIESNPLPDYMGAEEFKNLKVSFLKFDKNIILISLNTFSMPLCKLFESRSRVAILKAEYKPEFLLRVKSGVRWHDDTPFTADDVIFTYETVSKIKKIPAYDSYNISSIESIEKTRDGDIRVVFKYPTPRAFEALQMPILPRHKLENQDIFNARFNMMPIGTGPFKFVERAFEDYIILERNEKYFGGAPDVEKITFRILPNESIMFLELLQGNIDIMQLKPDQFVKFTDTPEFEKRFVKIKYPEREYTYIGWNLKNRLFADEKVRVAISSAIDKNALIEKTLYNLGQISDGPFYPSSWASNPTIKNIAYDVNAAKKNLEEAGWSDMDADGFLEKKIDVKSFFGYDDTVEIQRFEFGLLINAGNKDRELCAKFIASELKKIGIKVNVDTLEWKDFIKLIDSTSFDAFILTWSLGYDPDISSIWHSSNIPDMKRGKFGLNSISYKNPEVDALLDEARQTIDQNRRIKCYHRIHEIIIKQQPYCFLYIADTLYAVARKIKNAKPSQAGIFYNIEKWKIE
ncbi:MAG TPA: ABC transporter substrate-binding protein [Candidatus Wallbacteria bacterium]|nr:ABC transporter substrate-binding protein [Candidatus Wallbacteria bacterium]